MSLFAIVDVQGMSLEALEELGGICQHMMSEQVAEAHWKDYQELLSRIHSQINVVRAVITIQSAFRAKQAQDQAEARRKEIADQTKAALTIQSLFRAKQAQDQAEARRKELADQTKAALTIQSAFRMYKAKDTLEALRIQQELKTQQDVGDALLAEQQVKAAVVAKITNEQKIEIGRLKQAYDKLPNKPKGAKANHPAARAQRLAQESLDSHIEQIVHLIESQLAAEKKKQDLARTVQLPEGFKPNGAMVDYKNFLYPGAGYLDIGGKHFQLHPNRSLIHVKDEVADDANLATANAYLNSVVKACKSVIEAQKNAPVDQMSQDIWINDTTAAGEPFRWKILYKRLNPAKQQQGFAGSIEHIDSGYHNSRWLPNAKRYKCVNCGKAMNRNTCADHRNK